MACWWAVIVVRPHQAICLWTWAPLPPPVACPRFRGIGQGWVYPLAAAALAPGYPAATRKMKLLSGLGLFFVLGTAYAALEMPHDARSRDLEVYRPRHPEELEILGASSRPSAHRSR